MDEPLASQPEGTEASASAPASPTVDLEQVRTELRAEFDARIGGFQTVINKLTEENRQLKTSTLSDEEREQLALKEAEDYIEQLERKVALGELASQYPAEVAKAYQQLLDARDGNEQVQFLASLMQPKAPEPEAQIADVDRNNPAPTVGQAVARLPDGTPMDGATADEWLKRLGPNPVSSYSG